MLSPLVVHCKHDPYDVYIGRPSKWGNPFSHLPRTIARYRVRTRDDAIKYYEEWVVDQPELMICLPELDGRVLGCWCAPRPCHGHVLVRLVAAIHMP